MSDLHQNKAEQLYKEAENLSYDLLARAAKTVDDELGQKLRRVAKHAASRADRRFKAFLKAYGI